MNSKVLGAFIKIVLCFILASTSPTNTKQSKKQATEIYQRIKIQGLVW